jgi:2-dehydro-3-deoxygluconokinase
LKKIVTFGEVLLRLSKPDDLRLAQGRTFNGNYGGSEANAAVSLATLGNQVEYVSRIPDNAIGRACAMRLREYGLRLNHVVWGGERLGTYYFEGSAAMRNSHVVYDRSGSSFYTMAPGMIDWRTVFQDAAIFHCSGITCALSASAAAATMEGVRIAEEMGVTIACDINYRKNLWHYGADAHETLKELASHADIIFGDQGEYEVVTGLPRVPFNATDSQAVIDRKAFSHYLRAVHEQLPKCKKMVLACRNQLTSSHHILTGMLLSS